MSEVYRTIICDNHFRACWRAEEFARNLHRNGIRYVRLYLNLNKVEVTSLYSTLDTVYAKTYVFRFISFNNPEKIKGYKAKCIKFENYVDKVYEYLNKKHYPDIEDLINDLEEAGL